MSRDVIDLRDFYSGRLGLTVRRVLRGRIRDLWPNVRGEVVLGLGFATPFLRQFRDEADRVIALMPPEQGILAWPAEGPYCVALADNNELPLPDFSVDRVLLVHSLEHSGNADRLLSEVWRVLNSRGRLMVVVPNRTGLWARTDRTPFGFGRPYSSSQLHQLLRNAQFIPESTGYGLHIPPARSRLMLKASGAWEDIGGRWFPGIGGVVIVEAGKQIYARPTTGKAQRRYARPRLLPAITGNGAARLPSEQAARLPLAASHKERK